MIDYGKLLDLLGDKNLVDKYITLVKVEIPKELDQLDKLIKAKEYSEASVVAHSIKSQCIYMGLDVCAALALNIEKQTENLQIEQSIEATLKKLKSSLGKYLSE